MKKNSPPWNKNDSLANTNSPNPFGNYSFMTAQQLGKKTNINKNNYNPKDNKELNNQIINPETISFADSTKETKPKNKPFEMLRIDPNRTTDVNNEILIPSFDLKSEVPNSAKFSIPDTDSFTSKNHNILDEKYNSEDSVDHIDLPKYQNTKNTELKDIQIPNFEDEPSPSKLLFKNNYRNSGFSPFGNYSMVKAQQQNLPTRNISLPSQPNTIDNPQGISISTNKFQSTSPINFQENIQKLDSQNLKSSTPKKLAKNLDLPRENTVANKKYSTDGYTSKNLDFDDSNSENSPLKNPNYLNQPNYENESPRYQSPHLIDDNESALIEENRQDNNEVFIDQTSEYVVKRFYIEFKAMAGKIIDIISKARLDIEPDFTTLMEKGANYQLDYIIETLGTLSINHGKLIVELLLVWRKNAVDTIPQDFEGVHARASHIIRERKSLATLFLLCRTLNEVVLNAKPTGLDSDLGARIEMLVFNQIKDANPINLQLSRNRRVIHGLYVQIAGGISRLQFASISDCFIAGLEQIPPQPKANIEKHVLLIRSIRYLKLMLHPMDALEETGNFLLSCAKFFSRTSGSLRMKHAWAMSLTELLMPLAGDVGAEVNLPAFSQAIEMIHAKASKMASRARHVSVAFPLVAACLCLSRSEFFHSRWQTHLEMCIQRLKDKHHRLVAMDSICRILWVYLFRYPDSQNSATRKLDSLFRILFPVAKSKVVPKTLGADSFVYILVCAGCYNFDFTMRTNFRGMLSLNKTSNESSSKMNNSTSTNKNITDLNKNDNTNKTRHTSSHENKNPNDENNSSVSGSSTSFPGFSLVTAKTNASSSSNNSVANLSNEAVIEYLNPERAILAYQALLEISYIHSSNGPKHPPFPSHESLEFFDGYFGPKKNLEEDKSLFDNGNTMSDINNKSVFNRIRKKSNTDKDVNDEIRTGILKDYQGINASKNTNLGFDQRFGKNEDETFWENGTTVVGTNDMVNRFSYSKYLKKIDPEKLPQNILKSVIEASSSMCLYFVKLQSMFGHHIFADRKSWDISKKILPNAAIVVHSSPLILSNETQNSSSILRRSSIQTKDDFHTIQPFRPGYGADGIDNDVFIDGNESVFDHKEVDIINIKRSNTTATSSFQQSTFDKAESKTTLNYLKEKQPYIDFMAYFVSNITRTPFVKLALDADQVIEILVSGIMHIDPIYSSSCRVILSELVNPQNNEYPELIYIIGNDPRFRNGLNVEKTRIGTLFKINYTLSQMYRAVDSRYYEQLVGKLYRLLPGEQDYSQRNVPPFDFASISQTSSGNLEKQMLTTNGSDRFGNSSLSRSNTYRTEKIRNNLNSADSRQFMFADKNISRNSNSFQNDSSIAAKVKSLSGGIAVDRNLLLNESDSDSDVFPSSGVKACSVELESQHFIQLLSARKNGFDRGFLDYFISNLHLLNHYIKKTRTNNTYRSNPPNSKEIGGYIPSEWEALLDSIESIGLSLLCETWIVLRIFGMKLLKEADDLQKNLSHLLSAQNQLLSVVQSGVDLSAPFESNSTSPSVNVHKVVPGLTPVSPIFFDKAPALGLMSSKIKSNTNLIHGNDTNKKRVVSKKGNVPPSINTKIIHGIQNENLNHNNFDSSEYGDITNPYKSSVEIHNESNSQHQNKQPMEKFTALKNNIFSERKSVLNMLYTTVTLKKKHNRNNSSIASNISFKSRHPIANRSSISYQETTPSYGAISLIMQLEDDWVDPFKTIDQHEMYLRLISNKKFSKDNEAEDRGNKSNNVLDDKRGESHDPSNSKRDDTKNKNANILSIKKDSEKSLASLKLFSNAKIVDYESDDKEASAFLFELAILNSETTEWWSRFYDFTQKLADELPKVVATARCIIYQRIHQMHSLVQQISVSSPGGQNFLEGTYGFLGASGYPSTNTANINRNSTFKGTLNNNSNNTSRYPSANQYNPGLSLGNANYSNFNSYNNGFAGSHQKTDSATHNNYGKGGNTNYYPSGNGNMNSLNSNGAEFVNGTMNTTFISTPSGEISSHNYLNKYSNGSNTIEYGFTQASDGYIPSLDKSRNYWTNELRFQTANPADPGFLAIRNDRKRVSGKGSYNILRGGAYYKNSKQGIVEQFCTFVLFGFASLNEKEQKLKYVFDESQTPLSSLPEMTNSLGTGGVFTSRTGSNSIMPRSASVLGYGHNLSKKEKTTGSITSTTPFTFGSNFKNSYNSLLPLSWARKLAGPLRIGSKAGKQEAAAELSPMKQLLKMISPFLSSEHTALRSGIVGVLSLVRLDLIPEIISELKSLSDSTIHEQELGLGGFITNNTNSTALKNNQKANAANNNQLELKPNETKSFSGVLASNNTQNFTGTPNITQNNHSKAKNATSVNLTSESKWKSVAGPHDIPGIGLGVGLGKLGFDGISTNFPENSGALNYQSPGKNYANPTPVLTQAQVLSSSVTSNNNVSTQSGGKKTSNISGGPKNIDRLRLSLTMFYKLAIRRMTRNNKGLLIFHDYKNKPIVEQLVAYVKETHRFLSNIVVQQEWEHQALRIQFCGLVEAVYLALLLLPLKYTQIPGGVYSELEKYSNSSLSSLHEICVDTDSPMEKNSEAKVLGSQVNGDIKTSGNSLIFEKNSPLNGHSLQTSIKAKRYFKGNSDGSIEISQNRNNHLRSSSMGNSHLNEVNSSNFISGHSVINMEAQFTVETRRGIYRLMENWSGYGQSYKTAHWATQEMERTAYEFYKNTNIDKKLISAVVEEEKKQLSEAAVRTMSLLLKTGYEKESVSGNTISGGEGESNATTLAFFYSLLLWSAEIFYYGNNKTRTIAERGLENFLTSELNKQVFNELINFIYNPVNVMSRIVSKGHTKIDNEQLGTKLMVVGASNVMVKLFKNKKREILENYNFADNMLFLGLFMASSDNEIIIRNGVEIVEQFVREYKLTYDEEFEFVLVKERLLYFDNTEKIANIVGNIVYTYNQEQLPGSEHCESILNKSIKILQLFLENHDKKVFSLDSETYNEESSRKLLKILVYITMELATKNPKLIANLWESVICGRSSAEGGFHNPKMVLWIVNVLGSWMHQCQSIALLDVARQILSFIVTTIYPSETFNNLVDMSMEKLNPIFFVPSEVFENSVAPGNIFSVDSETTTEYPDQSWLERFGPHPDSDKFDWDRLEKWNAKFIKTIIRERDSHPKNKIVYSEAGFGLFLMSIIVSEHPEAIVSDKDLSMVLVPICTSCSYISDLSLNFVRYSACLVLIRILLFASTNFSQLSLLRSSIENEPFGKIRKQASYCITHLKNILADGACADNSNEITLDIAPKVLEVLSAFLQTYFDQEEKNFSEKWCLLALKYGSSCPVKAIATVNFQLLSILLTLSRQNNNLYNWQIASKRRLVLGMIDRLSNIINIDSEKMVNFTMQVLVSLHMLSMLVAENSTDINIFSDLLCTGMAIMHTNDLNVYELGLSITKLIFERNECVYGINSYEDMDDFVILMEKRLVNFNDFDKNHTLMAIYNSFARGLKYNRVRPICLILIGKLSVYISEIDTENTRNFDLRVFIEIISIYLPYYLMILTSQSSNKIVETIEIMGLRSIEKRLKLDQTGKFTELTKFVNKMISIVEKNFNCGVKSNEDSNLHQTDGKTLGDNEGIQTEFNSLPDPHAKDDARNKQISRKKYYYGYKYGSNREREISTVQDILVWFSHILNDLKEETRYDGDLYTLWITQLDVKTNDESFENFDTSMEAEYSSYFNNYYCCSNNTDPLLVTSTYNQRRFVEAMGSIPESRRIGFILEYLQTIVIHDGSRIGCDIDFTEEIDFPNPVSNLINLMFIPQHYHAAKKLLATFLQRTEGDHVENNYNNIEPIEINNQQYNTPNKANMGMDGDYNYNGYYDTESTEEKRQSKSENKLTALDGYNLDENNKYNFNTGSGHINTNGLEKEYASVSNFYPSEKYNTDNYEKMDGVDEEPEDVLFDWRGANGDSLNAYSSKILVGIVQFEISSGFKDVGSFGWKSKRDSIVDKLGKRGMKTRFSIFGGRKVDVGKKPIVKGKFGNRNDSQTNFIEKTPENLETIGPNFTNNSIKPKTRERKYTKGSNEVFDGFSSFDDDIEKEEKSENDKDEPSNKKVFGYEKGGKHGDYNYGDYCGDNQDVDLVADDDSSEMDGSLLNAASSEGDRMMPIMIESNPENYVNMYSNEIKLPKQGLSYQNESVLLGLASSVMNSPSLKLDVESDVESVKSDRISTSLIENEGNRDGGKKSNQKLASLMEELDSINAYLNMVLEK
ncbi:hypothetical protein BB558_002912 [Smittium angustum]|uniref:Cell morphogenesis protein N-terminal domain-containing protein n=1 Tax=Smittium angustum TaxID=133377 RepID=A0A2U1J7R7_SMIAN|nr:hypothetical protein BB558_002912 [Smittium angustum]